MCKVDCSLMFFDLLPVSGSIITSDDDIREDIDDDAELTSEFCIGEELLMLLQVLLHLDDAELLSILPALLPVSDKGLRTISVIRRSFLCALTTVKVLSNLEKTEKLMRGK